MPHPHPANAVRPGRSRAGVSVVVVLLSLLAVGLVAVIAIPAYFNRPEVTLDNACKVFARDLRSLQNRAALDKVGVRLVFGRDGWRALDTSGDPIAGIGESEVVDRHFSRDGVFEGVTVERVDAGPDNAVGIDARGLIDDPAEFELAFRGERRLVRIYRGSGEVTVD